MPASWHAVRTQRHEERAAADALADKGFDAYLPMARRWARKARRRYVSSSPLFPQWMFTRFDVDVDNWGAIGRCRHVDLLVKCGDRPLRIPEREITNLRDAELAGMFDETASALAPGTSVMVVGGPLSGFVAQVVRVDPGDRVAVLVNFLGQQTSAMLSALQIVKI